jgi:nucleotide-binding universal stress UspA family protein
MSGDRDRPVVVAVGNDTNGQALDWAAAEASVRRCRLYVVHAERLQWAIDPSGLVPVVDFTPYRVEAEQVLREAVSRAHSVARDIHVAAELVFGPTVSLLVAHARGAQLLVLGSRDARFPRQLRGHLSHSSAVRSPAGRPAPWQS